MKQKNYKHYEKYISNFTLWLKKFNRTFCILNMVLLTFSALSHHGEITFSSILFTANLYSNNTNLLYLLIAIINHWYISAIDTTMVVNSFFSVVLSIEYLVLGTILSTLRRIETEYCIHVSNTKREKKVGSFNFKYITAYLIFMDFAMPKMSYISILVIIASHKVFRRFPVLVYLTSIVDCVQIIYLLNHPIDMYYFFVILGYFITIIYEYIRLKYI